MHWSDLNLVNVLVFRIFSSWASDPDSFHQAHCASVFRVFIGGDVPAHSLITTNQGESSVGNNSQQMMNILCYRFLISNVKLKILNIMITSNNL